MTALIYKCYACQKPLDTSKPVAETFLLGQSTEEKLKLALKKLHAAVPCQSCASEGCYGEGACPCGGLCHDDIERARREAQTLLNNS